MKTVVITSGYFNPLHPGHIECFELAKQLGDELWVIVNNDLQAKNKTGQEDIFQDEEFRMSVVSSLKSVDRILLSIDTDASVCASIQYVAGLVQSEYGSDVRMIFAKGGDRFAGNIPELAICHELGIEIKDGLGSKTHNSSDYRAKRIG